MINAFCSLGQYMFNKLKNKGNNNDDYIRQKMREKLEECEEGSRIRSQNQHVSNSVFSTQAWTQSKKISSIVESDAMMFGDHITAEYAKRYRAIHDSRWEEFISSGALNTLKEARWNMPQVLPFNPKM
ncbi:hypothetical protein L3Q82_016383 [Scortum barcoo]|uniref:Uncharacterized protein n=1 Tax=Scortum barcoo TaxID=214431 RepID=A0ACB8X8B1_9TELE|nr:hypothetical protein L3Q82_016383 [Scortum barcoo]